MAWLVVAFALKAVAGVGCCCQWPLFLHLLRMVGGTDAKVERFQDVRDQATGN